MNIEKLTFLMHAAAAGYSVVNFRYKRMKRIEVASEAKPKLFCPYSFTTASIFSPWTYPYCQVIPVCTLKGKEDYLLFA